jgi:large subunit ribosomal protein L6
LHTFIKMKKEFFKELNIPEGVEVYLDGNEVKVKGEKGENKKIFNTAKLVFEVKGNKIILGNKKATKKEKKMINTIYSHIKNMIKGVREGFEYKLKVCSSHFPMSVEAKDKEIIIKNFLGEKTPRKSQIIPGVNVKIEKDIITITSASKEFAGQTAANLETATRISGRDKRIFQDGIYITNKCGRAI